MIDRQRHERRSAVLRPASGLKHLYLDIYDVLADTSVTPEENDPSSSNAQRTGRQQSAQLWGMPRDNPEKERVVRTLSLSFALPRPCQASILAS